MADLEELNDVLNQCSQKLIRARSELKTIVDRIDSKAVILKSDINVCNPIQDIELHYASLKIEMNRMEYKLAHVRILDTAYTQALRRRDDYVTRSVRQTQI
jgi:hypothetical protein